MRPGTEFGKTLVALLQARAQHEPSRKLYTWLAGEDHEKSYLSYSDLDRRAQAIAVGIHSLKLKRKRALLLYRPGLEFIEALFGCLYAGVVAVPAYVPGSVREYPRITSILTDADCGLALTTADSHDAISQLFTRSGTDTPCMTTVAVCDAESHAWIDPGIRGSDVAYLQYTSGSTSAPRGVMVTHANVLCNLASIATHGGFGKSSVSVSWLPHFHDMGLIYGVLQPLFSQFPAVLLSPASFIRRPALWLQAISLYRGTHCGGPNFAYDLCVDRVGEEEKSSLNLSCWQVAFNGAEPIRQETLERFATHFDSCGFRRQAFYPVYGLAEATLKVTSGEPGLGARHQAVDAVKPANKEAVPARGDFATSHRIISCGWASADHEVLIADSRSKMSVPEGQVGEIWVAGPSVAAGYWRNAEATRKTFKAFLNDGRGPYLRTGDLGFLDQGELFITGRLKDCIIIRGRNHYPQDIEKTAEASHPAVRENRSAAFSVERDGQERLVIVCEVNRKHQSSTDECVKAVRAAIVRAHEIQAVAVVLIKSGSLPRTSSGKVQRQRCKRRWLGDDLAVVVQSVLESVELEGGEIEVTPESVLGEKSISRKFVLEDYIRCQVARTLHYPIKELTRDCTLIGLGVDSLAGFELAHKIETDLAVALPVAGLLDRSIEDIALLILQGLEEHSHAGAGNARLSPRCRPDPIPLSASQTQLWFLQQLFPESSAYNEHLLINFRGPLQAEALQLALSELVRRHEILRTTFPMTAGRPHQTIQPPYSVDLPIRNLARSSVGHRIEGELESLVQRETQRPFVLEQESPVRFTLWRASENEHFMLFVAHHIVCDGTSLRVVVRELSTLYDACANKRPSPLPELTVQYADYAAWQQEWLQGDVLNRQLAYWRQKLTGTVPLNLPTDYPRPSVMSYQGAAVPLELSVELTNGLKQLSHRESVTLFMSLLAGFQMMLSKYAGQHDVAVGIPVDSRNQAEVKPLIGFFVNTLVLRTDLSGNPSVAEVLRRVRRTTLDAYQHQDVPFEKLVEELQPERDLSHSPLFQVMLALQPRLADDVEFGTLRATFPEMDSCSSKFDLTFKVTYTTPLLRGCLEYNPIIFAHSTIVRMASHLQLVFAQMVGDLGQRLGELSLLTEPERDQVLHGCNRTEAEYSPRLLHELFEEQVHRTPEAIAVEYEGRELRYQELDRQANQLGHYLQKLGVGPETRVGICLERSLEMIVGVLGILKAGGVFVPLDPSYPRVRLGFMLDDAQMTVLLVRTRDAESFQGKTAKVVVWEEIVSEVQNERADPICGAAATDNLAYMIYTSGTTGEPKGVMVTHQAIVNHLQWRQRVYPLSSPDRFLHKASLSFDIATWEIFAPLSAGARLVLASAIAQRDISSLAEMIANRRVTIAHFNPSVLRAFLEEPNIESCENLRHVFCGGEVMSAELVKLFFEKLKAELHNQYGPTETCVDVLAWNCDPPGDGGKIPLGGAIDNTQAFVLDVAMEPVPMRVRGELCIGGDALARGYWNRPALTAERFVPNPFSASGGQRLYRTGDLVRRREDGNIEFMGRLDRQVKLRGFRVELEEIEAAFLRHAEVEQAAVVIRGTDAERRLVGYIVIRDGARVGNSQLRQYLRNTLPEYMVPPVIVELAKLPLTPNGKVDRQALPEAERESGNETEQANPASTEEEIVSGIFAEVLKRDRVGVKENFFDLGGHSLLATRVIAHVRTAFQVELPLRALFEFPTARGLAACVGESTNKKSGKGIAIRPLGRAERSARLPSSFAQQRMWFVQQLEPESAAYNMPFAVRLSGQLNQGALEKSLEEMARRHEVLHTRFEWVGEEVWQIIDSDHVQKIEHVDLTRLGADRDVEVRRLCREEANGPFDLARGPLLRMKLLQLEEQQHVLLVTMHHMVSDGWSSGIMMREFAELYAGYVRGEPSRLAELTIQYADYAVWQREWLQGEVLELQVEYWRKRLQGAPTLDLRLSQPWPAADREEGTTLEWKLSTELSGELKRVARRSGATLFMTLLGALHVLLQRYSGQSDISVGTPIAGRRWTETEGLIGFFVNTLVLRTESEGRETFESLLRSVRERTLEAYAHQDLPFEKLVERLQPERNLKRSPLFQVMLALDHMPEEVALPGLKMSRVESEPDRPKFDLSLTVKETDEVLAGTLNYRNSVFSQGSMRRLLGHWENLLHGIVRDPQTAVQDLDLLGEAERQQVLVEWNQTKRPSGANSIHDLFEEQVERTPDAVAIEYEGQQFTYSELDEKANQLGRYLRYVGLGADERVGICMERSPKMIVGLLGILKAGGAYVPLDPSYPEDRLAFMLEDADLGILLTQENRREHWPPPGIVLVDLDANCERIAEESTAPLQIERDEKDTAYVMYTSGSTGKPKGVIVEHRQVCNQLKWSREAFGLGPEDRILQKTSVGFDVSILEIFLPLTVGARIIVARHDRCQDVDYLVRLAIASRVTFCDLSPSLLEPFFAHPLIGQWTSLRVLTSGSEVIRPELVQVVYRASQCVLWNAYGPTEATVQSTAAICAREDVQNVSIGKPILNTQVYVLDNWMCPVPVGVAGELFIGGAGLARGYWNRAALTAERFVPNPFNASDGERLYRTGDLVRYREDGNLEFLGRSDRQVKLRGFRIELEEIEAAVGACDGVGEVAVVLDEDHAGEKRLIAYVAGRVGMHPSSDRLRNHLRKRLPEHMVPAVYIELDELPLTLSGKVDRKRLPPPSSSQSRKERTKPRSSEEEILCGIFADVLRVERVGVDDNFFELGGHSLLAMRIVARIRVVFRIELPISATFEFPTVSGLAKCIEENRKQDAASVEALPPVRMEKTTRFPLSFAQERLWFLDQLHPHRSTYNLPIALRLKGELFAEPLERAWTEMVRRHEVLRTRFEAVDEQVWQVIEPARPASIQRIDLSQLGELCEDEVRSQCREESDRPFDLASGPLFRVKLLQLGEQEHVLLVTVHHIACDAWSIELMAEEFGRLYAEFQKDETQEQRGVEEPGVQYGDYAVWQRGWLKGQVLSEQLGYWEEQLAGLAELELPTDRARTATMGQTGGSVKVHLSQHLSQRLSELSHREGVTLFMTLLAGLQIVLSKYSQQDDVAVGTAVTNRPFQWMESLIGFFVNTLVLRTDLNGNPSVRELLQRVRRVALEAYRHHNTPFEMVVDRLQPERDPSRTPLFRVMLVLQSVIGQQELTLEGLELTRLEVPPQAAKFDLFLQLAETQDGIQGELTYARDVYGSTTAERMMEHLRTVLEVMAETPETRIDELRMLRGPEREDVLRQRNLTDVEYPSRCLHELFEEQVQKTPDATAVECEGGSLSYAELNRRANQLGRYLRNCGVSPEARVGICLERSADIVVALLGVLKAGGAYVPLDPAYPEARLQLMVRDCQAQLVVTRRRYEKSLGNAGTALLCLDESEETIRVQSSDPLSQEVASSNLAYVIYTSGSTGKPKGVAIAHCSATVLLYWARDSFRQTELESVLASTSVGFDLSVFEVFVPLSWGGKVRLVENAMALLQWKGAGAVSLINTVPSAMTELISMKAIPESVRTVNLAGEPLSQNLVRQVFDNSRVERICNLYGPTEDTTYSTYCEMRRDDDGAVAIGRPIANTQAYVLDRRLEPTPVSVAGQLHLAGAGLARGYLNRPALTAERFVPNPFGLPGARMYQTGDRVRWRADGMLEYLGRLDHQVKLRGFRIELDEIVAVLSELPGVKQATVVLREDSPGDKRLVSYIVPGEPIPSVGDLRSGMRKKLPEHMIPWAFVLLNRLPLTTNGKLDRKALPKPEVRFARELDDRPRSALENTIAAIWQQVLRVDHVGIHDDFFDLGGNSLLMLQIISKIRERSSVDVDMGALFEGATVAALAAQIERTVDRGTYAAPPPLVKRPRPQPKRAVGEESPVNSATQ
jgi:amino acid adenylation domain-containing protein